MTSSARILVVVEDVKILASLERGLRLSGFRMEAAADGASALSEAIGHILDRITLAQRRTEDSLGSARGFVSVSAHELRTSLTSTRTGLEVLRASLPTLSGFSRGSS